MNKRLIIILAAVTLVAASCNKQLEEINPQVQPMAQAPIKKQLVIGGHKLEVELEQTPSERQQGLSDRASLDENAGMLFMFGLPDIYGFWMKDMNFPLDFIWIKDGKVAEIMPDISQIDQKKVYEPASPIDTVLEVNAGWAAKNGIKVGDSIDLTN